MQCWPRFLITEVENEIAQQRSSCINNTLTLMWGLLGRWPVGPLGSKMDFQRRLALKTRFLQTVCLESTLAWCCKSEISDHSLRKNRGSQNQSCKHQHHELPTLQTQKLENRDFSSLLKENTEEPREQTARCTKQASMTQKPVVRWYESSTLATQYATACSETSSHRRV